MKTSALTYSELQRIKRQEEQQELQTQLQAVVVATPQAKNTTSYANFSTQVLQDLSVSLSKNTETTACSGEIQFNDTDNNSHAALFDSLLQHFDIDGNNLLDGSEFAAAQMMKAVRDNFRNPDGSVDQKAFAKFVESHEGMSADEALSYNQVAQLYGELFADL